MNRKTEIRVYIEGPKKGKVEKVYLSDDTIIYTNKYMLGFQGDSKYVVVRKKTETQAKIVVKQAVQTEIKDYEKQIRQLQKTVDFLKNIDVNNI